MPVLASALKDTLVVLDLGGNDIGNLGAESLTQLTRLQRLDLIRNGITAAGAAAIAKISTLRHLDISSNSIGDEGCGHLAALPSLQSLKMRSIEETPAGLQSLARLAPTLQQLTITTSPGNDDMSGSIAQLTNLTFLRWDAVYTEDDIDIDEAVEEGLSLTTTTALSSLKQLQQLSLSGHIALGLAPNALAGLAGLTRLTSLDLDFVTLPPRGLQYLTQVTSLRELTIWIDAASAPLARLTSVTKLRVGADSVGVGGAAYVGAMTNLRHLSFSGYDVRVADRIASLTGLTYLDVNDMDYDDQNAGDRLVRSLVPQLAKLRNLQLLIIPRVGVGAAGAAEIAKLTMLTHLNICSNDLGDEGVAWVARLPNLTYLELMSNGVGAAGAAELAQLTNLTYLGIACNDLISDEDAKMLCSCLTKLQDSFGL